MSTTLQLNPFEYFSDLYGGALSEGYIYIGEPNKDPIQFPVSIYYDSNLLIPAAQPLRTQNGYVVRNNAPTFLYIGGNYSILVLDKQRRQIYYVPDYLATGNSAAVSAADLANQVDPAKGAGLVGYKTRTLYTALTQLGISPFDFGAKGDFVTDDTIPVQKAIDAAIAQRRALLINGDFGVTHVDINAAGGMTVLAFGTLTGIATTTQESILTIRNLNDLKVQGRLVFSGGWNVLYEAGVAVYTTDLSGVSKIDIDSFSFAGCKVGMRIGRRSEPDALLSEITISGGYFYGCPTCYELIGTQTVVTFIGCNMITGIEGAPPLVAAAWAALPRSAVRSFGANYKIIGGEALITDVTTGLLFDNRPIASPNPSIGNRYGKMDVTATIESASPLVYFWNPEAIPSIVQAVGSCMLHNCDGFHSQNLGPLILCYDDFGGQIIVHDNPIDCLVARTFPNIAAGVSNCRVTFDENSFGRNFQSGLDSVTGGSIRFTFQKIAQFSSLNQTIATGVSTAPLVFTNVVATPGSVRYGPQYNTSPGSGVFTVPNGGLKSVQVSVNFAQGAPRPNSFIALQVNGVPLHYAGVNGETYINTTWQIGDLVAGTTLQLVYNAGSGTNTFSFTPSTQDRMIIAARN